MWYNIDLNFRRAAVQIAVAFPSNVTLLLVSIDTFYMFCNLNLNLHSQSSFTTWPFSYVPLLDLNRSIYVYNARKFLRRRSATLLCGSMFVRFDFFVCVFFFTTGLLELLDSSS